jgi:hypothetical protein
VRGPEYLTFEAEVRARLFMVVGPLTFREVARTLDLSTESVRRALRTGPISLEMAVRVCERFGVSIEWLVFGRGLPPRNLSLVDLVDAASGLGLGAPTDRLRYQAPPDEEHPELNRARHMAPHRADAV